jgi:hypothetical protein
MSAERDVTTKSRPIEPHLTGDDEVAVQRRERVMTPQDNDVNKPRKRRSGSQDRLGTVPILLGAAVAIILGIWLSTG